MSAEIILPPEIVIQILNYLPGNEIFKCRRVCRLWRDVVDGLSDESWKRHCDHDLHYVESAHENSTLSWRELYKSLHLWSKIHYATMTTKKFPRTASDFQLLPDGMIGVCENHTDNTYHYSDTIVYYDLESLEVQSKESFDFLFCAYKENEKLISVVDRTGKLCVIPKETRRRFFVGKLNKRGRAKFDNYTLFSTSVYYQDSDGMMCRGKLKKKKTGEYVVKNYVLLEDRVLERITAFSYIDEERVNVLSNEFNKANIYRYDDKEYGLSLASSIDRYTPEIVYELSDYGFKWTNPAVLNWLLTSFDRKAINITDLDITSLVVIGTTILLATHSFIQIYLHPYTSGGELVLYDSEPNKVINLNDLYHPERLIKKIKKLDAMEFENGHRLIALSKGNLYLLEFTHDGKTPESSESCTEELGEAVASCSWR